MNIIIKDITHRTPATNKKRNLKAIKKIVRHYSATPKGDFDSFWNHWNGDRGWGTGGYHEIILRDGTVELCYPPEQITNGVANMNSECYHICLVGDKQTGFTAKQEEVFYVRTQLILKKLGLGVSSVFGHGELTPTSCPNINMNTVRGKLRDGHGLGTIARPDKKPITPNKQKPSVQVENDLSIVDYLKSKGIDSSFANRKKLADQHGILNYKGTSSQNIKLLNMMKNNEVIKPSPSKRYTGNSIVDFLKMKGIDSSFANRKKLAEKHGISNYKGTAQQNIQLLNRMNK